jgi:hypothetical protein
MDDRYLLIMFVLGIFVGAILYSLFLNYIGYEIYQPDYVESLKLCVYSHNWNSTACLYHKPF